MSPGLTTKPKPAHSPARRRDRGEGTRAPTAQGRGRGLQPALSRRGVPGVGQHGLQPRAGAQLHVSPGTVAFFSDGEMPLGASHTLPGDVPPRTIGTDTWARGRGRGLCRPQRLGNPAPTSHRSRTGGNHSPVVQVLPSRYGRGEQTRPFRLGRLPWARPACGRRSRDGKRFLPPPALTVHRDPGRAGDTGVRAAQSRGTRTEPSRRAPAPGGDRPKHRPQTREGPPPCRARPPWPGGGARHPCATVTPA